MTTSDALPDAFPLSAYLRRIGVAGSRPPSAELLCELHVAHLAALPFENLDILLGQPVQLDVPALAAKMIAGGRGGYCFEQNTLFRAALESLGFEVVSLAARVRAGAPGVVRPKTHMLLQIDLPGGAHLADVGFGGDGPLHPLPLVPGREIRVGGIGHRLRREADLWVLESDAEGAWADLYAFTLERQYPVDVVMANHFTSTFPRSPFVQGLTVQRSWPERRLILRNRELLIREGGEIAREAVHDPEHLLEILRSRFGLSFPTGTRFAKPDF